MKKICILVLTVFLCLSLTSCASMKKYFSFEAVSEAPHETQQETAIISEGIVPELLCSKEKIPEQEKAGITDLSSKMVPDAVITADRNGNIVIKLDLLDEYKLANIHIKYSVILSSADTVKPLLYISEKGSTYLSVKCIIKQSETPVDGKIIEYSLCCDEFGKNKTRYIWLEFNDVFKISCPQISVSAYTGIKDDTKNSDDNSSQSIDIN